MAEVAESNRRVVKLKDSVVIVDRAVEGTKPVYCIHGHTWCVRCHHKVWLGTETLKAAQDGSQPLCIECGNELRAKGVIPEPTEVVRLQDHLRADGPHE